ncbi:hypothetical protein [Tropicibacter sp. S64]|uniref:hypothetical protein n=1 Tax=Tropicibacter sp. S64 TaxID=3415122 RepID=UPI003C7BFB71
MDDSYISDELCVGTSCDGSENYGGDTLTLKATGIKIFLNDTSTASLPDRDWSIRTNVSALEEFVIKDDTANRTPFQIAGGTPDSAFYIAASGNLGFGTIFPQTALHVMDQTGFNAALRLQTSMGNASTDRAIDLRVAGTEFLVQNVTQGKNPFRIRVDAPSNSFSLAANGSVGIGTTSPATPLHVLRTDGTAGITVENTADSGQAPREMFRMVNFGGSYFTLANSQSNKDWYFVHENNASGRFFINHSDGGRQMALTPAGDMTLEGQLFTVGSCAAGCDRVFDEDYPLPTIAEQGEMMRALKHLPNVGPTPEDGPFNITQMTGGMLNELEKAHLYIGQLSALNAALEAKNAEMEARLAALEAVILGK